MATLVMLAGIPFFLQSACRSLLDRLWKSISWIGEGMLTFKMIEGKDDETGMVDERTMWADERGKRSSGIYRWGEVI